MATSYYSDDPNEHAFITGKIRAHGRTTANIREAVRRGAKVRVGVIGVRTDQRTGQEVNLFDREIHLYREFLYRGAEKRSTYPSARTPGEQEIQLRLIA